MEAYNTLEKQLLYMYTMSLRSFCGMHDMRCLIARKHIPFFSMKKVANFVLGDEKGVV